MQFRADFSAHGATKCRHRFNLPQYGLVSLVLEDNDGNELSGLTISTGGSGNGKPTELIKLLDSMERAIYAAKEELRAWSEAKEGEAA